MSLQVLIPWTLVAVLLLALAIELLVSHKIYAKAETTIAELLQQQRIDQRDINDARTAYHRVVRERDLARDTVRNLLDIHRHGGPGLRRLPRMQQPLPMPPDVDDALTEQFTQITERNTWPKWPPNPGRPS